MTYNLTRRIRRLLWFLREHYGKPKHYRALILYPRGRVK